MRDNICIVGLGYVGLPLAVAFAEKFSVVGFDVDFDRIEELKIGYDRTCEIAIDELKAVKDNIIYLSSLPESGVCNIYIITVPTPIDSSNRPDLTPLIKASQSVGKILTKDDIVIYESTVYPGVTEEICVPELERASGLRFNIDFFCGYSPERINPGDKKHTVKNILKVTSGSNSKVADRVDELYREIVTAGTYKATSIKVAEASKVIENTQRDVNIALINELALIFNEMNLDTHEILAAASTKWNFIKMFPGLVGGHCIGVDPYYLTYKAEQLGYKPNLILASRQINNGMGKYIAEKTIKHMIKAGSRIKNSNVLVLGVTFKEDCPDMRNTKVLDIIRELDEYGAKVHVYDPLIDINNEKNNLSFKSIPNPLKSDRKYDAIVVALAHKEFKDYTSTDYDSLKKDGAVLIDVKGIVPDPTWRL